MPARFGEQLLRDLDIEIERCTLKMGILDIYIGLLT